MLIGKNIATHFQSTFSITPKDVTKRSSTHISGARQGEAQAPRFGFEQVLAIGHGSVGRLQLGATAHLSPSVCT